MGEPGTRHVRGPTPRHPQAVDDLLPAGRQARPVGERVRDPPPRRERRGGPPLAARTESEAVRGELRDRHPRRHLPDGHAPALRDHPGGTGPPPGHGPGGVGRRVQHAAGAGLRERDPQGVRVEGVAGGVDAQPGRVHEPDPARGRSPRDGGAVKGSGPVPHASSLRAAGGLPCPVRVPARDSFAPHPFTAPNGPVRACPHRNGVPAGPTSRTTRAACACGALRGCAPHPPAAASRRIPGCPHRLRVRFRVQGVACSTACRGRAGSSPQGIGGKTWVLDARDLLAADPEESSPEGSRTRRGTRTRGSSGRRLRQLPAASHRLPLPVRVRFRAHARGSRARPLQGACRVVPAGDRR